jgi:hypothetical protein
MTPPSEPPPDKGGRPWYLPFVSALILNVLVLLLVDIDLVLGTLDQLLAAVRG